MLNLFISSSSFLKQSLGYSIYSTMSSVNKDILTSSFSIWMSLISSSCLIVLARIFSTILNKRGENGHPCLVPHHKENTCTFCPLSIWCLQWIFYIWPLLHLSMFPLFPLCWGFFFFYHKWVLDFPMVLCIYSCDNIVLPFILFMWCIIFIVLQMLYKLEFTE